MRDPEMELTRKILHETGVMPNHDVGLLMNDMRGYLKFVRPNSVQDGWVAVDINDREYHADSVRFALFKLMYGNIEEYDPSNPEVAS